MITETDKTKFLKEQDLLHGRSLLNSIIFSNLLFTLKKVLKNRSHVLPSLDLHLYYGLVRPDISICRIKEINWKTDKLFETEPPFGVIEIVSSKKSYNAIFEKIHKIYFPSGVKSVWMVNPELDNIYVFTSPDDYEIFKLGETLHDKSLDIKIEIDKVFE